MIELAGVAELYVVEADTVAPRLASATFPERSLLGRK
jgi:hypothetical protein